VESKTLAPMTRTHEGGSPTRHFSWAILSLALCLGACVFDTPPTEGTSFACDPEGTCPRGFDCVESICRAIGTTSPDAATGRDGGADAGTAPTPDAPASPDAAPPVDAGPRTLTFGERPDADVKNVTTDTWLDSTAQTTPHGSDVELVVDPSPQRATLIRFDLAAIPPGSTVTAAEVVWVVFDPISTGSEVKAQVLLLPWSETEASWANASAGRAWPNSGATGASIASTIVATYRPDADGEYAAALLPAVVQAWVDAPASNYGLRWQSSAADGNNLRVHSRESAVSAEHPLLRVTFTER